MHACVLCVHACIRIVYACMHIVYAGIRICMCIVCMHMHMHMHAQAMCSNCTTKCSHANILQRRQVNGQSVNSSGPSAVMYTTEGTCVCRSIQDKHECSMSMRMSMRPSKLWEAHRMRTNAITHAGSTHAGSMHDARADSRQSTYL